MTAKKCLTEKCRNTASHKGLCLKHYSSAKKLVESGKTTWEELANMGLAEVEQDAFVREFLNKKGGQ